MGKIWVHWCIRTSSESESLKCTQKLVYSLLLATNVLENFQLPSCNHLDMAGMQEFSIFKKLAWIYTVLVLDDILDDILSMSNHLVLLGSIAKIQREDKKKSVN